MHKVDLNIYFYCLAIYTYTHIYVNIHIYIHYCAKNHVELKVRKNESKKQRAQHERE